MEDDEPPTSDPTERGGALPRRGGVASPSPAAKSLPLSEAGDD